MKKLGFVPFVPLLVFTALLALNPGDGTEAANPGQEIAALTADVSNLDAAAIEQALSAFAWKSALQRDIRSSEVSASSSQENLLRLKSQVSAASFRSASTSSFLTRRSVQPDREIALFKTLSTATEIPVEVTDLGGTPITSYTIGDTIVITITYGAQVWLEPYIDNGDGEFSSETDLLFTPSGEDEEIVIEDGDEDDETDPGDGVWQIKFDTGDIGEGAELFAVQGAKLFLSLSNEGGGDTGLATLDVLAPTSTTSVSGSVTVGDVEPAPAPNVIVVAFPWQEMMDEGSPQDMALTMTNAEGDYTLAIEDDVADADFQIMAFDFFGLYSGLFPDPQVVETPISPGDELEVDFVLIEATATISGTLTDENDNTIGGVRIYANNGPYTVEDVTGEAGMYSLDVIPGYWRVELSEDDLIELGYMVPREEDDWINVPEGDLTGVDFSTYVADAPISGTVLWSDEITPAENAEIWCETPAGYFTRAETGPDGAYTLNVSTALDSIEVPDDDWGSWVSLGYWVNVWAEDALSQPNGQGEVRAGSENIDFTLYHSDVFLSGHIYDEADNPLRNAGINAYTIDSEEGFSTGTGSWNEGYYELSLLSGYNWVIEVYHPDWWGSPAVTDTLVSPASGSSHERDYHLPAIAMEVAVEGHVFDGEGRSIANARVEISQTDGRFNAEINTDGGGYFRFEGVPAYSEFDMVATAPGLPPGYQHIWTSDWDVYVEFWLGGEARIRVHGEVTDGGGSPIADAVVLAFEPDQDQPVEGTFTDMDGYYELFIKTRPHTIKAGANGYLVSSVDVDLPAEVPDTTINFMLASAGDQLTAHVSGTVTDEGGYGLGRVFVGFISSDYVAFTNTLSNGSYSLDLKPGDYLAVYQKEGFHEEFRDLLDVAGEVLLDDVIMHTRPALELVAVDNIPEDHGRQLLLQWNVNPEVSGMFTRFVVWEVNRGSEDPDPYDTGIGTPPRAVGTVPVHPGFMEYGFVARTLADGLQTWYMVTAHGYDTWEYWDSNFMWGISSDERAPELAPSSVVAEQGTAALEVNLTWTAAIDDPVENTPVSHYTVYRAAGTDDLAEVATGIEATEYTDAVSAAGDYRYAVTATDFAGNESVYSEEATYTVLSVVDGMALPKEYALGANYPNPFNPSTTINYQLPEAGQVTLQVYDLTGKVVSTLVNDYRAAGYHQVVWNGRDRNGASVATGVYFYRITAGQTFNQTRKMVLIK